MGYADWHFMMKDFENNKGFRNAILTAIVLAFLIFIALFVWFKIEERKRDAVEMVFVEHILPHLLLELTEENLDKTILEAIQTLKSENNSLYEELETMRQNYQIFLLHNDKPCILDSKQGATGHYRVENPYKYTIQEIEKEIRWIKKGNKKTFTEIDNNIIINEFKKMDYLPIPSISKIQYFCVK